MKTKIGKQAPKFTLPAHDGDIITLNDFRGRKVVLYFYPKDDTPGCTKEACYFRDEIDEFSKINAEVIGISKDTMASHTKFRDKHNIPFILASDERGEACSAYGVWKEKNMYGRKYMGIERSTFLIDEDGRLRAEWRKVKVPGHIETVLKTVREMENN